jgi:hypothetical protein
MRNFEVVYEKLLARAPVCTEVINCLRNKVIVFFIARRLCWARASSFLGLPTIILRHTTRSVGLLWTSDQPVTETCTWKKYNIHKRQTSVPEAEFEPTIPGSERPQTHALDRAATGFGRIIVITVIIIITDLEKEKSVRWDKQSSWVSPWPQFMEAGFHACVQRAKHLCRSWTRLITVKTAATICWRSILILSFLIHLGLPSGLVIFDLITRIIFDGA